MLVTGVYASDETEGWIHIDTLNGGGGGGAIDSLNDLLDVDINNPGAGDIVESTTAATNTGQWTGATPFADGVTLSPAFDGTAVQRSRCRWMASIKIKFSSERWRRDTGPIWRRLPAIASGQKRETCNG